MTLKFDSLILITHFILLWGISKMLFSCPSRLCYTASRPFCDREAANSKEELGILVVGWKWLFFLCKICFRTHIIIGLLVLKRRRADFIIAIKIMVTQTCHSDAYWLRLYCVPWRILSVLVLHCTVLTEKRICFICRISSLRRKRQGQSNFYPNYDRI